MRLTSLCLLALGCGGGTTSTTIPDPSLSGDKTWYGVVGPLVETRCGICHQPGNIAPFPLDSYEQVKAQADAIQAAVSTNLMPPFPPDQTDDAGCPRIDDVRRMSDDERTVLLDWLAAGLPEGDVTTLPDVPKNEPLGPPSDTWQMTEEYNSTAETVDDYRCFIIPTNELVDIPIAAVSVLPGTRSVVHHAAVYLVPPSSLAAVQALDNADPQPGYSCFGGVGVDDAYPAGLWVPGNDAPLVPPNGGVGYYLPVGYSFVIQMHYNFTAGKQPDRSSVVAWRANAIITEVPHDLVLGDESFTIPPGAMDFSTTTVGSITAPGTSDVPLVSTHAGQIYSVWGHEHLLGHSFQMDLVHPDGSSQCLLHIPQWQFNWQSIYKLKDFVQTNAGDQVKVTCSWDNPNAMPVSYGENSSNEMCFGAIVLVN